MFVATILEILLMTMVLVSKSTAHEVLPNFLGSS